MNRRGFLQMMGIAPLAPLAAMAIIPAPVDTIVMGIDGGADDLTALAYRKTSAVDFELIAARYETEIARIIRQPASGRARDRAKCPAVARFNEGRVG